VLYGSHARGDAHERSDINLLVLAHDKSPAKLRQLQKAVAGWSKHRALPPVIFSADQFERGFDAFALEFAEMCAARKILAGSDPFHEFKPDWVSIRTELEQEARRKRIELQRRWLASGGNVKLYPAIVKDTFRGFLTLIRGVRFLENRRLEPISILRVLDGADSWKWYDPNIWKKLRALADDAPDRPKDGEWSDLMDGYLLQSFALVRHLDEMTV
jgi:hypothetical protein